MNELPALLPRNFSAIKDYNLLHTSDCTGVNYIAMEDFFQPVPLN